MTGKVRNDTIDPSRVCDFRRRPLNGNAQTLGENSGKRPDLAAARRSFVVGARAGQRWRTLNHPKPIYGLTFRAPAPHCEVTRIANRSRHRSEKVALKRNHHVSLVEPVP